MHVYMHGKIADKEFMLATFLTSHNFRKTELTVPIKWLEGGGGG